MNIEQVHAHLFALLCLAVAFIIVAAIHAYRFGKELEADRVSNQELYNRMRRERIEKMTAAERIACGIEAE